MERQGSGRIQKEKAAYTVEKKPNQTIAILVLGHLYLMFIMCLCTLTDTQLKKKNVV